MRRRNVLKTALGLPAAAALPFPASAQAPAAPAANPASKLETLSPDAATTGVPRFFSSTQFHALRQLSTALVPAYNERPSALDAGVPEFLDFYISESDASTQQLWRNGLDRLAAGVTDATLAPLKQPWTYNPPADPFARFLLHARDLVLQATFNSRESTEAGGRRAAGLNYFWRNPD